MTMNISGVIGLGLFVLLVVPALMSTGVVSIFVNIPGLIMCVGGAMALGTMSFGIGDMIRGVRALRVLLVRLPPETISSRDVSVLRGLVGPVYASGLICVLIGQINMLVFLEDPSMIGSAWATLLTCPFYALLMAEVVLRPAIRLIEHDRLPGGDAREVSSEPKPETEVELA
jgi:flagellar motor component MotA